MSFCCYNWTTTNFFVVAGEAPDPKTRLAQGRPWKADHCHRVLHSAAIALTGMLCPSTQISTTSGLPVAFAHRSALLTAAGQVVTLPVVVLLSLLAQPQLSLSLGPMMAFYTHPLRSLLVVRHAAVSGIVVMAVILPPSFPITYLDDLTGRGILFWPFGMTNSVLDSATLHAPVGGTPSIPQSFHCLGVEAGRTGIVSVDLSGQFWEALLSLICSASFLSSGTFLTRGDSWKGFPHG